jgi:hypothetical protein
METETIDTKEYEQIYPELEGFNEWVKALEEEYNPFNTLNS